MTPTVPKPGTMPAVAAVHQLKRNLEALPAAARLSDADTELLYGMAYQQLLQGHLESAFRHFSLLTLYRPTRPAYLQGLALSCRMLGRLDEALNVYVFLAAIAPQELGHSVSIAECLLLQDKVEEAGELIETVLACSREAGTADSRSHRRAQALGSLIAPSRHRSPA